MLLEAAAAFAAGAETGVGAAELDGGELEALSRQRLRQLAGARLEGTRALALDAQVQGAVAHPQVQLERPGRASVELEMGGGARGEPRRRVDRGSAGRGGAGGGVARSRGALRRCGALLGRRTLAGRRAAGALATSSSLLGSRGLQLRCGGGIERRRGGQAARRVRGSPLGVDRGCYARLDALRGASGGLALALRSPGVLRERLAERLAEAERAPVRRPGAAPAFRRRFLAVGGHAIEHFQGERLHRPPPAIIENSSAASSGLTFSSTTAASPGRMRRKRSIASGRSSRATSAAAWSGFMPLSVFASAITCLSPWPSPPGPPRAATFSADAFFARSSRRAVSSRRALRAVAMSAVSFSSRARSRSSAASSSCRLREEARSSSRSAEAESAGGVGMGSGAGGRIGVASSRSGSLEAPRSGRGRGLRPMGCCPTGRVAFAVGALRLRSTSGVATLRADGLWSRSSPLAVVVAAFPLSPAGGEGRGEGAVAVAVAVEVGVAVAVEGTVAVGTEGGLGATGASGVAASSASAKSRLSTRHLRPERPLQGHQHLGQRRPIRWLLAQECLQRAEAAERAIDARVRSRHVGADLDEIGCFAVGG